MRRILNGLIVGLFVVLMATSAFAGSVNNPKPNAPIGPTTNGLNLCQNGGNYSWCLKNYWNIAGFNTLYSQFSSGATSTDWQGSSRTQQTTNGPISRAALLMVNGGGQTGGTFEQPGLGFTIMRASLEYPSAQTPYQFSVSGSTTWVMDPNAPFTITDPVGVSIPANTNYWIRYYNRVPFPPTSPSASAATVVGGSLTASTQYFYKVTTLDTGLESGATSEFSSTTGVSTLANNLTWTGNTNAQGYNIYRSTTTNAEVLIASVFGGTTTGYQDTGAGQIVSTKTPPAAYSYYFNQLTASSKLQANTQQSGGTGADLTTSTGGTWISSPSNTQMAQQDVVLTDDFASNSVCFIGDSIMDGVGIITNAAQGFSNTLQAWPQLAIGTSRPMLNESIPGSRQIDLVNGASTIVARRRLGMAQYCNIIMDGMGRNDLYTGSETWQTLALDQLQVAKSFADEGKRYFVTTLTPNTTSTDSYITATNQTVSSVPFEAKRVSYNTWVRGGFQVDGSGNPVTSGGTPTTTISGYFELANLVEVNSSNVLTQNGGLWLAPASAAYTGQVLTGSPTATSLPVSTASYPVSGLTTYVVQMTSGARSGQFCMAIANTATGLTCGANGVGIFTGIGAYVGLSGSPSAGDTFNLYQINTPQDGVHATANAYAIIAAAYAPWLAALPVF